MEIAFLDLLSTLTEIIKITTMSLVRCRDFCSNDVSSNDVCSNIDKNDISSNIYKNDVSSNFITVDISSKRFKKRLKFEKTKKTTLVRKYFLFLS